MPGQAERTAPAPSLLGRRASHPPHSMTSEQFITTNLDLRLGNYKEIEETEAKHVASPLGVDTGKPGRPDDKRHVGLGCYSHVIIATIHKPSETITLLKKRKKYFCRKMQ